MIHTKCWSSWC